MTLNEIRRFVAEDFDNPLAKIRHHWARRFPQIPFNSQTLRDFLIAECGQSADTVDDLTFAEAANFLVETDHADEISRRDLLKALGVSTQTLTTRIKKQGFPKPIRTSGRMQWFSMAAVDRWEKENS